MQNFRSIDFADDNLRIVNQTLLPFSENYIVTDDFLRIAESIIRLEVRGAPAIGIAAAYAVALAFKNNNVPDKLYFDKVKSTLAATRPTAVNLFYTLERMENRFVKLKIDDDVYTALLSEAKQIHKEDIEKCNGMAKNGLAVFQKKSVVLTHCNTGALATGGDGTAFAVIKYAFQNGMVAHVYSDETRPLLQGSRLTAFELEKAGIPFTINVDSAAAHIIKEKKVDLIITGADRIAANGDSANKIGTYGLAVLAKHHGIPFYIAAPSTTIDKSSPNGKNIKIEERSKLEVTEIKGVKVTKDDYNVYSPAFDVTPAELISGIITEKDLYKYPYKF
jgi:methylthioribose-1-phosphate isomerase